jgi:hypothetical protein
MTRKSLCAEIKTVNLRLNRKHKKIQALSTESQYLIKQVNPFVLIGIGLLSGATVKLIGFRKLYKVFSICQSAHPLLTNFAHVFMNQNVNE